MIAIYYKRPGRTTAALGRVLITESVARKYDLKAGDVVEIETARFLKEYCADELAALDEAERITSNHQRRAGGDLEEVWR